MAFAVQDDFNRADAATLGPDWTRTVGTDDPAIVSNQAQFDGHGNGSTTLVTFTDQADTTTHGSKATGIVFDAASGAADMGVACRIADASNYIYAKLDGGGVVTAFEVVAGSQSTLGGVIAASVASAASDVFDLELSVDGTTVDVTVTNVTQAVTDTGSRTTTLTSGLGVGMWHTIQFGLGHNIDEFEADGIASAPAVPAAPTDVTVAASPTSGRLDVSWTDSPNASPVQTYQIEQTTDDPTGSPTWVDVSGAQAIAQGTGTFAVTGLTDGTDHTFRVLASNTNGDSAWVETGTLKPGQVKTVDWSTRESPPNGRTGDADPDLVTAARAQTESFSATNRHGQRDGDMNTAPGSSGSTTNVSGDITIDTAGNRIHVDAASQNYGDTQLRILEPIDFLAYPVSFIMNMQTSVNGLAGWARQSIVDERVAWTSFQNFNTTGPVTANGFDIQWRSDIQGPLVFQYVAGVETQLTDTTGSTGYSAGDATVEITLTSSAMSITVDGTEVFQGTHTVPAASLEAGWIMFGAHNHATVKEVAGDVRQSEVFGPFTFYSAGTADVVGMVDNNTTAMTNPPDAFDGIEIGWDVPTSPSTLAGVLGSSLTFDLASVGSGALLYFDGQDQDAVASTANTIEVSVNGNAWTAVAFRRDAAAAAFNVVDDLGGNLVGWLTTGQNTIDFRADGADTFGGPIVANITVFTYGAATQTASSAAFVRSRVLVGSEPVGSAAVASSAAFVRSRVLIGSEPVGSAAVASSAAFVRSRVLIGSEPVGSAAVASSAPFVRSRVLVGSEPAAGQTASSAAFVRSRVLIGSEPVGSAAAASSSPFTRARALVASEPAAAGVASSAAFVRSRVLIGSEPVGSAAVASSAAFARARALVASEPAASTPSASSAPFVRSRVLIGSEPVGSAAAASSSPFTRARALVASEPLPAGVASSAAFVRSRVLIGSEPVGSAAVASSAAFARARALVASEPAASTPSASSAPFVRSRVLIGSEPVGSAAAASSSPFTRARALVASEPFDQALLAAGYALAYREPKSLAYREPTPIAGRSTT